MGDLTPGGVQAADALSCLLAAIRSEAARYG
jgi:hypothetical protein